MTPQFICKTWQRTVHFFFYSFVQAGYCTRRIAHLCGKRRGSFDRRLYLSDVATVSRRTGEPTFEGCCNRVCPLGSWLIYRRHVGRARGPSPHALFALSATIRLRLNSQTCFALFCLDVLIVFFFAQRLWVERRFLRHVQFVRIKFKIGFSSPGGADIAARIYVVFVLFLMVGIN